jgi:hypothetical protein
METDSILNEEAGDDEVEEQRDDQHPQHAAARDARPFLPRGG